MFVNLQNIFSSNRFKIQPIACIIVSRNCFRITVYHDSFITKFFKCKRRMYTTIIKLNSLSNSIWTASQNHNLFGIFRNFCSIWCIICRIIIIFTFNSRNRQLMPTFDNAKLFSLFSYIFFTKIKNFCKIFIRKAIFFCFFQKCIAGHHSRHF